MVEFYSKKSHFTKDLKERIKRVNKKIRPIARTKNIVVQKLESETLLYDLESDRAFCLNDTSAKIWHLCDGTKTVTEISDVMSVEMKSLVSEEVIWLAIDQFQKDGLINELNASFFGGTSRREVIRKVGFTSLIALPIVSSLVAPKAVAAQSCAAVNGACMSDPQCCPGAGTCKLTLSGGMATPRCCVGTNPTSAAGPGENYCALVGLCPNVGLSQCCTGVGAATGNMGTCNPGAEECVCS